MDLLLREEIKKCCTLQTQLNVATQQLTEIKESAIEKKLEAFQKALYRHQITTPEQKIYTPEAMKQFTDKNSPGLFEDILNCLSVGKSLSSRRKEMQEQRVVSLLHIMAYFRSQKTSTLQKDSGLYAASSGMSLQGLSAGQILGYSTTPRNVQQLKADLSKGHTNYISQQLQRVNEVSLQINKLGNSL